MSWVTDFSLMAGISSRFFGSLRTFVQVFTTGKLAETLPQSLKNCGYRNMLFFPFDAHFLSHDKFYKSIGFDEVFDRRAQGIAGIHERDRVYFENALSAIDRHLRASSAPFFVYVQTMTAHGPYAFKYLPGEDVAGGGPGTSPAMSEYLRRAAIVQRDGEWLIEELKRRFPSTADSDRQIRRSSSDRDLRAAGVRRQGPAIPDLQPLHDILCDQRAQPGRSEAARLRRDRCALSRQHHPRGRRSFRSARRRRIAAR